MDKANFGNKVMTDHGTQFYANKRDKNGEADCRFENFLEKNKIKHIKVRIKHPQTNGKFEKSLDTKWYLQKPDIAFWSRLPEGCKLKMFLDRMETELNVKDRI